MYQINSILIPVDFTEVAKNALRYALKIAEYTGAKMLAVHCIPDTSIDDSPFIITPYYDRLKKAKGRMASFLHTEKQLFQTNSNFVPRIDSAVRGSSLKKAIATLVDERKVDLLIMGTHGRYNAWDKVLGSKATYLINQELCPVLVVPEGASFSTIKSICIAMDASAAEVDASALNPEAINSMFAPFNPQLHLLHIVTDPSEKSITFPARISSGSKQNGSNPQPVYAQVHEEQVVKGLFRYAADNDCQLVVMHRPEKNWLARTFKSSNTRQAILDATLPVLITTSRRLV